MHARLENRSNCDKADESPPTGRCGLGLARPRADVLEACLGSRAKRRRSFRVV